jgi:hypothetical protein
VRANDWFGAVPCRVTWLADQPEIVRAPAGPVTWGSRREKWRRVLLNTLNSQDAATARDRRSQVEIKAERGTMCEISAVDSIRLAVLHIIQ